MANTDRTSKTTKGGRRGRKKGANVTTAATPRSSAPPATPPQFVDAPPSPQSPATPPPPSSSPSSSSSSSPTVTDLTHTQQSQIAALEAMVAQLQSAVQAAQADAAHHAAQAAAALQANQTTEQSSGGITPIERPAGEAGKDYSIREEMGLEEDYPLYLSISRTVKLAAIQTNAIAAKSFRSLPADKLAAIYRKVRDTHPYMDRRRFPGDWATAELLKQYLKNHRKYERRRGRWSPSGSGISSLPNIDEH